MTTDKTARFVLELQHKVAELRNKATSYSNKAVEYEKYADEQRANAINLDGDADRWQKLLDFAVLMQSNPAFAAEFAEAVTVMGSVDPFGETPNPLVLERQHDARTCPGCPLCTGYPDVSEPDDADEDYDEPMTNRDVDPEHVAECDEAAEYVADYSATGHRADGGIEP